ncbi:MAG TPA: squalene/phytoene synthase family protein [Planctomycetota bacterium]|nr:squalene/phytoene synthase family protein [Planctomycetota bacterium]
MPFWLRRPVLLAQGAWADRDRPPLAALARVQDGERFVWAVLPHAARTFSACITLLPGEAALASAVAYLYCRMLDSCEDLQPDRGAREAALAAFAARFDRDPPGPAPRLRDPAPRDARDRAHLLVLERAALVDEQFTRLPPEVQEAIRELVREMCAGMLRASGRLSEQRGTLADEEQLRDYCRAVLGQPVLFAVRLVRLGRGLREPLSVRQREDALRVGEFVQLANVTRDLEKDLARGVAWEPSLQGDLLRTDAASDTGFRERVRRARERLMLRAFGHVPAYAGLLDAMCLPAVSRARASAILMLLFTERYWRGCARRCGATIGPGPQRTPALLARAAAAALSARRAAAEVARVEAALLAVRSGPVAALA